jgi:hypothetical protein
MLMILVPVTTAPAQAEKEYEPLFDRFNFRAGFSWVDLSTIIRLDSELLGQGTTLDFEKDLNLGDNKSIPSLDFEWQIATRHRLAARWQKISRGSSSQALTEIIWGDEIIPIDAGIDLSFDITQYFVDYTYYPWVRERWAAGFGLGLRVLDLTATLSWFEGTTEEGGAEAADVTGPLPYLYFEYRQLLSDNWRFIAGLGWLDVTVGDISGGQWIGRASCEYLVDHRWSVGGALNLATIDATWSGIENQNGDGLLSAELDLDINDITAFARVRF